MSDPIEVCIIDDFLLKDRWVTLRLDVPCENNSIKNTQTKERKE